MKGTGEDMTSTGDETGEAVLQQALAAARSQWGERLVAAYALGSLAHGGFSALVSDVDLGLVLAAPLEADDEARVRRLAGDVAATGMPLGDRLSAFWGSTATLAGEPGGRFPPLDRLDLKLHGRLLAGTDVRAAVREPSTRELVLATARMALGNMSSPEFVAKLRDAPALVAAGPRTLTKRVLFPVRFVYTARTGQVGRNDAAVEYFTGAERGPAAELARLAFAWRTEPYDPADPAVTRAVGEGLVPLYRLFVEDYEPRLRGYGEPALADGFTEWRRRLE